MLVLSRKPNESLVFDTSDGPVTVIINAVHGQRVTLGIEAPSAVRVVRAELQEKQPKHSRSK
jgi:carbon storage regulator CsrA